MTTKTLIPSAWAVPNKFRARMGEAAGRQRHMVEDGHLLLVLHAVPDAGVPERDARLFWRDKAGVWKSSSNGGGAGALRDHVAAFEDAVDELEARSRKAVCAVDWFELLKLATPLQRTAVHLARTLQLAREAIDDRELINLRDRAGDVERAIDLVTLEARDAIDFVTARQAEAQAAHSLELARESHRLNIITAVFLPITALASIFSMTLRSGLENWNAPWLFWGIVLAGVTFGLFMRSKLAPPQSEPKPEDRSHESKVGGVEVEPA